MHFKSCAKINLALDILKKDESGFHQIQTIFYEYEDLYDEIEIEIADKIEVNCNWQISQNSAYQAAKLLQAEAGISLGARINITKNIPMGSGLGGAASNAATVLKALNQIWQLNFSREKLAAIGEKIGKDVPFFIYGGLALGTNHGEKIIPLSTNLKLDIKVLWPSIATSTQVAYETLDLQKCGQHVHQTEHLLTALKTNNHKLLLENIHNDFETLSLSESKDLKKKLYQMGAKKACLSGSGSAVFAIF